MIGPPTLFSFRIRAAEGLQEPKSSRPCSERHENSRQAVEQARLIGFNSHHVSSMASLNRSSNYEGADLLLIAARPCSLRVWEHLQNHLRGNHLRLCHAPF